MCLYLWIWSSVTNRAVAIDVWSPFQSSWELWPLWSPYYVLVVLRFCYVEQRVSPTPALYRRCVIYGYDMWRWSSTAEVEVLTSMFWFSPYKMARGAFNAIIVSVYWRWSLRMSAFYFSLPFLLFYSSFPCRFRVPNQRGTASAVQLTRHKEQQRTDATEAIRSVVGSLWCFVGMRRLTPSNFTCYTQQHNVKKAQRNP